MTIINNNDNNNNNDKEKMWQKIILTEGSHIIYPYVHKNLKNYLKNYN